MNAMDAFFELALTLLAWMLAFAAVLTLFMVITDQDDHFIP